MSTKYFDILFIFVLNQTLCLRSLYDVQSDPHSVAGRSISLPIDIRIYLYPIRIRISLPYFLYPIQNSFFIAKKIQ